VHDRVRQAAYDAIPLPERPPLHGTVAAAIEQLHETSRRDFSDQLAVHYLAADRVPEAIDALMLVGETARERYALPEALRALDQAIVLADRLAGASRDRCQVDLVTRRARVLFVLGRFAEIVPALERERQRVEALDDAAVAGPYHLQLGQVHAYLGTFDAGREALGRALDESRKAGDHATMRRVEQVLAMLAYWSGRFAAGVAHGQRAVAAFTEVGHASEAGMASYFVAMNYWAQGLIDESLEAAAHTERLGALIADSRLRSLALSHSAMLHAMRGSFELAEKAGQRGLETARTLLDTALAQGCVAYVCLERGQPAAAITALEEPIALLERAGLHHVAAEFMAILGEAHVSNDAPESGRVWADRALAVNRNVGFALGIASAERTLGLIELAAGAHESASHHLNAARTTFEAVEARFELARTRLALAELAHLRGDRHAAGVQLTEAMSFFSAVRSSNYLSRVAALATRLCVDLPTVAIA
ncbi:MAG: hypothetical protein ACREK4_18390, partial [Candidatus Rokuibacteriota bacterium]